VRKAIGPRPIVARDSSPRAPRPVTRAGTPSAPLPAPHAAA